MRLRTGLAAPLGALSLALTASVALGQSAADRAVEAAKAYSGETLTITWEAGLQALDPLNYSGPRWEELTGVKIQVVEIPINELFTKTVAEHRAGTGAYDMLNVVPAWMPDLVNAGVLEPLDDFVDKYGYRDELQDIAPTYRDNQMTYGGKIYGLPDDGDVFLLYYRTDLFANASNKTAFQAAYGYELAPPKDWQQFYEISEFFTNKYQPSLYGSALIHAPGLVHYLYLQRFRTAGGKLFDADSMKSQINGDVGVAVLEDMVRQLDNMPKGAAGWGPIEVLNAWLAGELAMQIWWPPPGRWSAGYGVEEEALSWLPKSTIAGKVGYAMPPDGQPELAAGRALGRRQQQEQGAGVPVRAVAEQQGRLDQARHAALCPARSVPHLALQQRRVQVAVAGREGLPRGAAGRGGDRPARPLDHRHLLVRGVADPGGHLRAGRGQSEGRPR